MRWIQLTIKNQTKEQKFSAANNRDSPQLYLDHPNLGLLAGSCNNQTAYFSLGLFQQLQSTKRQAKTLVSNTQQREIGYVLFLGAISQNFDQFRSCETFSGKSDSVDMSLFATAFSKAVTFTHFFHQFRI